MSRTPVVEARGLCRVFPVGDVPLAALDDVTFTIHRGEFVSIMGPSGSGKSTLLNLLGCLDRPTSGTLLLDGTETGSLEDASLSKVRNATIGFIFQSFNLLSQVSVLENVILPLTYARTPWKERASRGRALLRAVNLEHKALSRPNQLSGGQCQRVAVARALVNRPALILADEPTGNLDSKTGIEIIRLLSTINRHGVTIVMVTHDVGIAHYTRRILTIQDGRLETDESIEPKPLPPGEIELDGLYPGFLQPAPAVGGPP